MWCGIIEKQNQWIGVLANPLYLEESVGGENWL